MTTATAIVFETACANPVRTIPAAALDGKRNDEIILMRRQKEKKSLQRGYRKRSPSPRRVEKESGASVEDKFGIAEKFGPSKSKASSDSAATATATDKAPERPPATAATAVTREEPMIIVHVNDRLGTKAAIPCLASDPIKLFKAQVAARIGRQPHEILLKRQGERPFKDQLTLEDYGVSNGVQIDLEIDTGE